VHGVNDAEFAIVLSDQWQGHGLGSHFLKLLLEIGRQEGVEHVIGQILPDNYPMQRICKKLGFGPSRNRVRGRISRSIRKPASVEASLTGNPERMHKVLRLRRG
jgi:hypothetical protein